MSPTKASTGFCGRGTRRDAGAQRRAEGGRARHMIPRAYRVLLRDRRARRLLSGLGVSALGDGMSTVTIAWLAIRTAPSGELGLFVGLAVAAYTLPGAFGALALGRYLRHRPARTLVLATACFAWVSSARLPRSRRQEHSHLALTSHCLPARRCWRAGEARVNTPCSQSSAATTDGLRPTRSRAHRCGSRRSSGRRSPACCSRGSHPAGCSRSTPRRSPSSAPRPGACTPLLRRPRNRSMRTRPNPASVSSAVTICSA